jgi:opacity protein-like surface antigen
MRRKGLFLIVSLLIFSHYQVQANVCCSRCCWCDSKFYTQVFGGASFLQTKTKNDIKPISNTGYIVGGSFGFYECHGLRLEAEFAYRRNSLSKVRFFCENFEREGHFQSFSYMGNVIGDIFCTRIVQPYLGGGIGYDSQKTVMRGFGLCVDNNKKGFAWQVIAGLKHKLPCFFNMALEYKFHQGRLSYIYCHSLSLCLGYEFGCRS